MFSEEYFHLLSMEFNREIVKVPAEKWLLILAVIRVIRCLTLVFNKLSRVEA